MENIMKKILSFLFLALILTGCATRENYDQAVRSWIGAPKERLTSVSTWSVPARIVKTGNNKEKLIYIYDQSGVTPVEVHPAKKEVRWEGDRKIVTVTPAYTTGGEHYRHYCKTTFFINNGYVSNVTGVGNYCIMTDDYKEASSRY